MDREEGAVGWASRESAAEPPVYPAYAVPRGIIFDGFTERRLETSEGTVILSFPILSRSKIEEIAAKVTMNRIAYLAGLRTGEI
ncbi:hypothetical protein K0U00_47770, partial [Paenibacillus sepulcri]|nr:hypothetical protein [Paenibacillus sepulcri]